MAALPFFYCPVIDTGGIIFELDEPTSRHCTQVLRMKAGEQLNLTDGKGLLATAVIRSIAKKACAVSVVSFEEHAAPVQKKIIAISLLKNAGRFEWFLEKAAELGITGIVPLQCKRTEKQHFRTERMQQILISAMLQSQQTHLTELHAVTAFNDALKLLPEAKKCIAHCYEAEKQPFAEAIKNMPGDKMIFIGPEGDFTEQEVEAAVAEGYIPVSLGNTRLRTETAGIAAAVMLNTP